MHLDPDEVPPNLVAPSAEISNDVRVKAIAARVLPRTWRQYPSPKSLADIGNAWIEGRETAVLAVPSAVIPQELNYLLNPAHADFAKIRIHGGEPFAFDPRMWKSK